MRLRDRVAVVTQALCSGGRMPVEWKTLRYIADLPSCTVRDDSVLTAGVFGRAASSSFELSLARYRASWLP